MILHLTALCCSPLFFFIHSIDKNTLDFSFNHVLITSSVTPENIFEKLWCLLSSIYLNTYYDAQEIILRGGISILTSDGIDIIYLAITMPIWTAIRGKYKK